METRVVKADWAARIVLALVIGIPVLALAVDSDGDSIDDTLDNCPMVRNAGNAASLGVGFCDADLDGYGNACDGDFNQTNTVTVVDYSMFFVPNFVTGVDSGTGTDMNCNGEVNEVDFEDHFLPQLQRGLPGPSGLACAGTPGCQ
jgi:hypothetical protein